MNIILFELMSISKVNHTESYLEIVAIVIIMNDKKRILVVLYDVEFMKIFCASFMSDDSVIHCQLEVSITDEFSSAPALD